MTRRTAIGAAGVALLALAWFPAGWNAAATLAGHMLQHLLVMNGAALLFALAWRPAMPRMLAIASVLQILLLWGWHVPPVYVASHHSLVLTVLMQASLLASSFLFWSAVLAHPVERSWQTILAALLTAKAFCLFGAILCFARRPLYPGHGDMDDQQLAGLLMMASCALVYVVAAVALFLRWLDRMGSWRAADA